MVLFQVLRAFTSVVGKQVENVFILAERDSDGGNPDLIL
jgi:hypothetical protein